MAADRYEELFGAGVTSKPADYALEYYVDKVKMDAGFAGEVDIVICISLMVAAYRDAFPDSPWQPADVEADSRPLRC
ncbi:hypothetical protein ACFLTJ_00510 [Chloroflexota bacterium]